MKVRNIKALAPFKGYVVRGINFEKIGAQIKLDFDKRSGPRCPHCENKLPRNKIGRRAVMDCPMSHGSIVYLDFPTVQGLCRSCDRDVIIGPHKVHPDCHASVFRYEGLSKLLMNEKSAGPSAARRARRTGNSS